MKITYVKDEGKMFPPFYYGFGYFDMCSYSIHFFIWPLNIFVRLWRAFREFQIEKWRYLHYLGETQAHQIGRINSLRFDQQEFERKVWEYEREHGTLNYCRIMLNAHFENFLHDISQYLRGKH